MTAVEDRAPPSRTCGECQVCCKVTTIDLPEIQKESGAFCRHGLGGGCGIYDTRPQVCRAFYCGWRLSRDFPDDWRPDRSGIFAVLENSAFAGFQPVAVAVYLLENPSEIVRQSDFIQFIVTNVRRRVPLYLVLPGGRGMLAPRLPLNIPSVLAAAGKSGTEMADVLEGLLKRLAAYPPAPYVMKNRGRDYGS